MNSFKRLKRYIKFYKSPHFVHKKGSTEVYSIKRKHRLAYEGSEPANQISPRWFGKDYKCAKNSLDKDSTYRWFATTNYKDYGREITSYYPHPDPNMQYKVLWYVFLNDKSQYETRVVLCI